MTVTLHVTTPNDGSLLIEWASEHWRLALILEESAHQSSWHFVSDRALGDERIAQSLTIANRKRIADFVRDWEAGR